MCEKPLIRTFKGYYSFYIAGNCDTMQLIKNGEKKFMKKDEVIFENQYLETRTIVREFHKYCVSGKKRKLGIILLAIGIVLAVFMLLVQSGVIGVPGRFQAIFWEASIVCVFLGVIFSIYYRLTAAIAFKQDFKSMEGEIPETIVQFTDDDVIISELGKVKNFHYRELGELMETENLYAMMINRYAGIVVLKDSFTYGNPDEFKVFLEAKYNDAQPWKE